jgi:hypothetical protein
MSKEEKKFWKWFNEGIEKGWVTEPFCQTHDGGYSFMSEEEIDQWEEGGDPCMTVSRIMILG